MKTTITEAAEIYGKTKQTLSRQLKRHGVRPDAKGLYDVAQVAAACKAGAAADKNAISAAIEAGVFEAGSIHEKKLIEQVRKLTAEADTAEFKLAQLRGEHIPVDVFKAELHSMGQAFRQSVDIWIQTTAAEIGSPDVKKKLKDAQKTAYAAIMAHVPDA